MADITVTKKGEGTYEVSVAARSTTNHTVGLDSNYYDKLTGGSVTQEQLIELSFEFLLERESNTMILSRFDLPVIGQYFPEYEREIRTRL